MEPISREEASAEAYVASLNQAGREKEKKSFSQKCLRWMKDTQSIYSIL